jgi:ankyrin repeat protein
MTPLLFASEEGHVSVVRWLMDQGVATDERTLGGWTAWRSACCFGRLPVVRLLMERGADPTIAAHNGSTPLKAASDQGHLEVCACCSGTPAARPPSTAGIATGRRRCGGPASLAMGGLCGRCSRGANPTIADKDGTNPMAIAKQTFNLPYGVTAEGRRECVAALEVRS